MIKLLLHFLLHFGSNSFKNKRHGPIRNPFDKMPPDFKTSWRDLYDEICSIGPNIERIMSPGGYVSCLNRTKNAIERVQTLPTRSHKKSSSKSHPVWLRFGGSKRCHLPVICLGKTRHNPNIIIILMFRFLVVFYRETKWPKWTQMANFSMVWRLPGRHRKRCDDVLGAKTGLQRGRSAKRKHR